MMSALQATGVPALPYHSWLSRYALNYEKRTTSLKDFLPIMQKA